MGCIKISKVQTEFAKNIINHINCLKYLNKLDLKGFSMMHLSIASLIKYIDQLRTILLDKPCDF